MASSTGWRDPNGSLMLAADGFVLGAGAFITITALLTLPFESLLGTDTTLVVAQVISAVAFTVMFVAGPVFVWWLHRRRFSVPIVLGMLAGTFVGSFVTGAVFATVAPVLHTLVGGGPEDPPYVVFGLFGVVAVLFALLPVIEAVRDLRIKPPADKRLDWFRLAAFAAFVLLAGVVFPLVGSGTQSEAGEAGIFAVLFGAGTAFAMAGGNIVYRRRRPTAVAEAPAETAE